MEIAETVQHLHNAMTWDFRAVMIWNTIFFVLIALFIFLKER